MNSLHFNRKCVPGSSAGKFRTCMTVIAVSLPLAVAGWSLYFHERAQHSATKSSCRTSPPAERQNLERQLFKAAEKGDLGKVKELVDAGAEVNAVHSGHGLDTWLYEAGLPSGVGRGSIDYADPDGNTVLMRAALRGHMDVASFLISKGANVNITTNNGVTALLLATCEDHTSLVKLLLDAGADPNVQDDGFYGHVLRAAACKGNPATVKLLVDAHADLDAGSWCWGSPFQAAVAAGHEDIAKFLLEKGASPHPSDIYTRIKAVKMQSVPDAK